MLRNLLIVALLCVGGNVYAQELRHCLITKSLPAVNYPGAEAIPHSNNLVLPAGKALEAEGQRLVLMGRILDSRCMPVKDAQIEIWQPDPFGKWFLATRADLASPIAVFAGAGRGFSNTVGEFFFHTLFPSAVEKRAPFIAVKVKARGMKEFTTQLFFANDTRNINDPVFKKLKTDEARSLMVVMQPLSGQNGYAALIDIVLPERTRYVAY